MKEYVFSQPFGDAFLNIDYQALLHRAVSFFRYKAQAFWIQITLYCFVLNASFETK